GERLGRFGRNAVVSDQHVDALGRPDPGERLAADLGAVRDDDDLPRAGGHQLVDARLALMVRAGARLGVDRVDAEKGDVQADPFEDVGGQGPRELVRLRSGYAAG